MSFPFDPVSSTFGAGGFSRSYSIIDINDQCGKRMFRKWKFGEKMPPQTINTASL